MDSTLDKNEETLIWRPVFLEVLVLFLDINIVFTPHLHNCFAAYRQIWVEHM